MAGFRLINTVSHFVSLIILVCTVGSSWSLLYARAYDADFSLFGSLIFLVRWNYFLFTLLWKSVNGLMGAGGGALSPYAAILV